MNATDHTPTPPVRTTGAILVMSLICVAASIFSAVPAGACEADSVIDLFEKRINRHATVYLEYHKEAHSLLFGEREPQDGKIWLGPPKRYRIETDGQIVVRGADTLWTWSPETNQVTVRAGDLDSLEFGPVGFFGSVRRDFFAVDCREDKVDKHSVWKIRLATKTETAAIQRLTLWVDTKDHWVRAAEYVDYNEETTTLTFTGFRPGEAAAKSRFIFAIPKGAERVVLPSVKSSDRN